MVELDLDDIQGIIIRGYGYMPSAAFALLRVQDARAAKRWLAGLSDSVTASRLKPPDACVNVAFTYSGLKALGLTDDVLTQFSLEFQEGMTTEHRQRILGDHGPSAPENWRWGSESTAPVHIVLMLYAPDEAAIEALYASHAAGFEKAGVAEVQRLGTLLLHGRKEHFGFRDGIAQPVIEGKHPERPETDNTVKTGEFILGYVNEYGEHPYSPKVDPAKDPRGLLPPDAAGSGKRDFGRNGSYMVLRQTSQDVRAFWRFLDEKTKGPDGRSKPEARLLVAAKMVGRWPSGAPLAQSPNRDNPALQDGDNFGYHHRDPDGLTTPFGSHIRRTNPRDALTDDPVDSAKLGRLHRIIRRGRAYGKPLDETLDPQRMLEAPDDGEERGLQFICFNTNISRQFEFIQNTWINNQRFQGLYEDADPMVGDHDPRRRGDTGVFTIPADPVRKRITGLPRFTQVRGGAYFFIPGVKALRYLATL
jgi:Dyp-type peroxidase family